jgi:hypothetical protein
MYMMEIIIGAAAGAAAAALCALFYIKGVRDGMKKRGMRKHGFENSGAETTQNEFMRKYELIMSYDPYGITETKGDRI